MPAAGSPLGFTNRWYGEAIRQAQDFQLAENLGIRLVTGPMLFATKFEAFLSCGHGDCHMSHDLEDMISVIDGRIELADELSKAPQEVRTYLAARFAALLDDEDFLSGLPAHFEGDEASQGRVPFV